MVKVQIKRSKYKCKGYINVMVKIDIVYKQVKRFVCCTHVYIVSAKTSWVLNFTYLERFEKLF